MSDLPLLEPDQAPVKLSEIRTRQELAELLEVSDLGLRYVLYGILPKHKYRTFEISKKSGGTRRISAPNEQLKHLQRRLAKILVGFIDRERLYTVLQPKGALLLMLPCTLNANIF